MSIALVTGSGGLVGSEAARFLVDRGLDVVGIDNNLRRSFFGPEASTSWSVDQLNRLHRYSHHHLDIRNFEQIETLLKRIGHSLSLVVHAAGQPSHDWAGREPLTDFAVNAGGTVNLLEATRRHSPEAVFVFLSTNKVYGDSPNRLPFVECPTRWELDAVHPFAAQGINETMSIDRSMHSMFGASKISADIYVQEYGRYFGIRTACFRCGCLSGGGQSGAELHGFLAYLMKCTVTGSPYTVFGYKAKQVRDNIHSFDLVNALWNFYLQPAVARVYNIGGGHFANCSMLEAIELCEAIAHRKLNWTYSEKNRAGDHIWWISDISSFQADYPQFSLTYDLQSILRDIYDKGRHRWLVHTN